jgi:hypothetical protein
MCYGLKRLRSLRDSTIEIRFDLAIEPLLNRTDVCLLCAPHDVLLTTIPKNKCISVRYKILPIVRSCMRWLPYSERFFSMTPLLLIARMHGHATVCVRNGRRYHILFGISYWLPIFCSSLIFFIAITFIVLSNI